MCHAPAIWSGSISFGLVNIPVKLYSAVSRKTVHFNQLDARTNARIKQKRVSATTATRCPYEQIVKGYELASGAYVVVTDDELAALDPKALRTIDIDEFVDLADIDPIFYDSAYYLAPDKAAKPYALLAEAMERVREGRHRPLRDAHQAVPGRGAGRRTACSCSRPWSTPTRSTRPDEIPELAELEDVEVSDKELDDGRASSSSRWPVDFEPEKFQDDYRSRGARPHRAQGGRRRGGGAGRRDGARQGDRPHGRARGVGRRGQGVARPPPDRARRRRRDADDEEEPPAKAGRTRKARARKSA